MHQYTSQTPQIIQQDNRTMSIQIDSEFASLIPSQSEDENKALEQSLLSEGCRDALVIWKGHNILLDGHNRYAICQQHNLTFKTIEHEFETREDVIIWICQNQLARRNIVQFVRDELALRIKDALLEKGKLNMSKGLSDTDKPHNTRESIAEIAHTSTGGIAQTEYIKSNAPQSLQEKTRKGDVSRDRSYHIAKALSNAPSEYVDDILKLSSDEPEKIATLNRLYKTRGAAGSNGTFDEIVTTGGFHYGDDMDKWCNYSEISVSDLTKALDSLARNHAIINSKNAPPIMTSSKDIEYYTPTEYLDAARRVMGTIDLDPSSCIEANKQVRAANYYTKDTNGLLHPWFGNVWLNPPYGTLSADFGGRLIEEYKRENVKQAITLFNSHITDTRWFAPFWDYLVCFTNHRINFLNTDEKSGSTHGSCFVYLGNNQDAFIREFKSFGVVVKKVE